MASGISVVHYGIQWELAKIISDSIGKAIHGETDAPKSPAIRNNACGIRYKAFQDCINLESDSNKCQVHVDKLKKCLDKRIMQK